MEQQPVQLEDRSVRGKASFFADSTLFDVFTLPLARGTPATALTRPHTVVISESIANACFGETDPTGSPITLELGQGNTLPLTVSGVAYDLPENSHVHFDFLISYVTLESLGWGEPANMQDQGLNYTVHTYLLLREGISPGNWKSNCPVSSKDTSEIDCGLSAPKRIPICGLSVIYTCSPTI